jgi:hypothetical protein
MGDTCIIAHKTAAIEVTHNPQMKFIHYCFDLGKGDLFHNEELCHTRQTIDDILENGTKTAQAYQGVMR